MTEISLTINDQERTVDIFPHETLLAVLRREGYFGVKHGCEDGSCGACTVLVDGVPRNSCVTLAAQVDGCAITTIEGVGGKQESAPSGHPELVEGLSIGRGWKGPEPLHALQEAFVETGAIQCGYCTPAQILTARVLLETDPDPTEAQVRDAIGGVLCRCTGYLKPVQAVLRAAARLRGESVPPVDRPGLGIYEPGEPAPPGLFMPPADGRPPILRAGPQDEAADHRPPVTQTQVQTLPRTLAPPHPGTPAPLQVVGQPEAKVDALKLVQGKPAFAADLEKRGMLVGKMLWSPLAHARIKHIDASQARALSGVHAVLTHEDLPRVVHSTAGQSHPIPGPLDFVSLDNKVRFVGDRVAAVAAESEEIAQRALELIEVEYEELPAILDPRESLDNVTIIHDQPDYVNFDHSDPRRNLAAAIRIDLGDVDAALVSADHVFEKEYTVQRVQQAPIEPFVCVTYWDEDDRLVIHTSTQVPFHVRRMLAPVLGLPIKRIRVVKPRIGGGFGNKQEVYLEDICAHLTIVTGRPVKMEYTREEHFVSSTSRHPMRIKMRTGVTDDMRIVANEMVVLSDTGAYGNHALTVTGNTGHKAMSLYNAPHIRFHADVVYTNNPASGAYRGYGVPQGFAALEPHVEWIARQLGWDPLEFRLKNIVRAGDEHPMSKVWSEGREAVPEVIRTCALEECARLGAQAIGWYEKREERDWGLGIRDSRVRKGLGVALVMQGTAIPNLDMGAASIKMNDDGSFNLLIGATDLGTGSDTVLTQMAAEVLGCRPEDFITYSSDTDFTPFDKGAYASSTTYISGAAVVQAAEKVAEQIKIVAARLLDETDHHTIRLADRRAWAPDGRSVTLEEVALNALHAEQQHQIMAVGSHVSPDSPPPFAAQFAEISADVETGQITVERLVMALDCGVIVNPATASGQVEGGMAQALGYAVSEEMVQDETGRVVNPRFGDYRIFTADEMPELQTIFVETFEPTHPFGIKAVAEIPLDGVAPAVVNAVYDATGVLIPDLPLTPERVWRALRRAQAPPGD
jgi:putative selenate reductase molybdopterin-binding subunit